MVHFMQTVMYFCSFMFCPVIYGNGIDINKKLQFHHMVQWLDFIFFQIKSKWSFETQTTSIL